MWNKNWILYTCLSSLAGLSGILLLLENLKNSILPFLVIYSSIYLLYAGLTFILLKRKKISILPFIITSLVICFFYYQIRPEISHDVFSYLMDGELISRGINPYLVAPADPQLVEFQNSELFTLNVWRDSTTIYPPMSLTIFSLVYRMYENFGIGGAKIILSLPFFALAWLFYKFFDKKIFALFILNPLILFETFANGHVDIWTAFFVFISLKLFFSNRINFSSIFLTLSVLMKLIPAVIFPYILYNIFRKNKKKLYVYLVISSLTFVVLFFPFLIDLSYKPLTRYIFIPLQHEFNSTFYSFVNFVITHFVKNVIISKHLTSAVTIGILFISVLLLLRRKLSIGLVLSTFILTLLMSPIVYPWYTIFFTPLIFWYVGEKNNFWIIILLIYFQLLISLTYISELTSLSVSQIDVIMNLLAVLQVLSLGTIIYLDKKTKLFHTIKSS